MPDRWYTLLRSYSHWPESTFYMGGFCSCFTIPACCKQSYRGSFSIRAQCTETQLVSNESLEKYLQLQVCHLYVKLLLHAVICITKCQRAPKSFSFNHSSFQFFSWRPFGHWCSRCSTIPEKLSIRSQWNFTCVLIGKWGSADRNKNDLVRWPGTFQANNPVKSRFEPYLIYRLVNYHEILT